MNTVDVKIINKSNNKLPKYETKNSSGLDVRADFSRLTPENPIKAYGNCQFVFKSEKNNPYLILDPGCRALIPTGLFVSLPEGYKIQVRPRSGLALKEGLSILNTPGTIDADYRGEIGIIIINHGLNPVVIENEERIAQLVLNKIEQINWIESNDLDKTDRGEGGFGHTNLK